MYVEFICLCGDVPRRDEFVVFILGIYSNGAFSTF
jgi:hypothetical protein